MDYLPTYLPTFSDRKIKTWLPLPSLGRYRHEEGLLNGKEKIVLKFTFSVVNFVVIRGSGKMSNIHRKNIQFLISMNFIYTTYVYALCTLYTLWILYSLFALYTLCTLCTHYKGSCSRYLSKMFFSNTYQLWPLFLSVIF